MAQPEIHAAPQHPTAIPHSSGNIPSPSSPSDIRMTIAGLSIIILAVSLLAVLARLDPVD